jgi:hypothetical protein
MLSLYDVATWLVKQQIVLILFIVGSPEEPRQIHWYECFGYGTGPHTDVKNGSVNSPLAVISTNVIIKNATVSYCKMYLLYLLGCSNNTQG